MKIKLVTNKSIADSSHRLAQEDIQVQVEDKITDVKIKATIVYTNLDPLKIQLRFNQQLLKDDQKILDILKRYNPNGMLVFHVTENNYWCCIIY